MKILAPLSLFLLTAALLLPQDNASAATLTFDAGGASPAAPVDGSANWDQATADFSNGTADAPPQPGSYQAGSSSSGSTTLTTSITGLYVGEIVSGTGIPNGDTIASIGTGNVTLATATTAANSGTDTFTNPNSFVFGSSHGTAGTVTLSGTQSANVLTLNPATSGNYTFSGGTLIVGGSTVNAAAVTVNSSATIASNFIMGSGAGVEFETAGQTLTISGTSQGNILDGGVTGSSATIAAASTLQFTPTTAATYSINLGANSINIGSLAGTGGIVVGSNATLNSPGTFNVGNGLAGTVGLATVNGTLNETGTVAVGRNQGGQGRLTINTGGIVTAPTLEISVLANGVTSASGEVDVAGGTLNATGSGGIVALNATNDTTASKAGTATLNISAGTANITEIEFGGQATSLTGGVTAGSGNLNVSGGNLFVGAGGIVQASTTTGTYAANINLSGGTVGAAANWTSALNMTLSNTNGGVTFQAANATGTAETVNLNGILSGSGGFKLTSGTGTGGLLTLGGSNTYTGVTEVAGSSILQLNLDTSLAAATNVILDTTSSDLFLNYGAGTVDTIESLEINGIDLSAGTYNSSSGYSELTGTGSILVLTSAPEPSAGAMLAGGLACLGFLVRRRRMSL